MAGKLPDMNVIGGVTKQVDLHKMRGPSLFCGLGQANPFATPSFSEMVPRTRGNLMFFSANYMGVALFIGVYVSVAAVRANLLAIRLAMRKQIPAIGVGAVIEAIAGFIIRWVHISIPAFGLAIPRACIPAFGIPVVASLLRHTTSIAEKRAGRSAYS